MKKSNKKRQYFFKHANWSLLVNASVIIYWFLITIVTTIFVITKWNEVAYFTFFTSFNGNNVIFIGWILLLLMPLVGSFKGFGIELDFFNKNRIANELSAEKKELDSEKQKEMRKTEDEISRLKREKEMLMKETEKGGKGDG